MTLHTNQAKRSDDASQLWYSAIDGFTVEDLQSDGISTHVEQVGNILR